MKRLVAIIALTAASIAHNAEDQFDPRAAQLDVCFSELDRQLNQHLTHLDLVIDRCRKNLDRRRELEKEAIRGE